MDKLAAVPTALGHPISADTVAKERAKLGLSRQHNRKADERSRHPDRNAQFEHINAKAVAAQAAGQPVASVDTRKKALVGNFKNGGSDYRPKGEPLRVNDSLLRHVSHELVKSLKMLVVIRAPVEDILISDRRRSPRRL